MRFALFLLAAVVFLIGIRGLAYGASSECEFIKDADQRNYCRAVSDHRKSWCEFIKNEDLRHRCRAIAEAK